MRLDDERLDAALRDGARRFGKSLWSQSGRVRAVLSDGLADAAQSLRAEIDLLELTAAEGIPERLVARQDVDDLLVSLGAQGLGHHACSEAIAAWDRALRGARLLDDRSEFVAVTADEATTPPSGSPQFQRQPTSLPSAPPAGPATVALQPVAATSTNGTVIAVIAIVVVAIIGGGVYLLTRNGDGSRTATGRGTSMATTVATTTTTSTTSTTAPAALPPPSEAGVRARFADLIASLGNAKCSPTSDPSYSFAFVSCSIDLAVGGTAYIYFQAWTTVEQAVYSIQHPARPKQIHYSGDWPVGGAQASGLYVSYLSDSDEECREWSYAGTQFEVQVCTTNAANSDSLASQLQR